ncbi:Co2+/Mg2+ efflux protein ApaG [Portibacter lacus]|uniref:Protein ApaG n=1 Tax=Portibacter lacus TaxID=1099794 RepID=A0AA37SQP9_9BACT|nr:Co2+/Mg2+ efflux protein ApaG [Portibacter lacus]GLR17944.1 protein ApaG [Portibacter lacus]
MSRFLIPDIVVKPKARYEQMHSFPHLSKFVHSYHIKIENQSEMVVQLISRHWFIVNGFGEVREVEGVGVIGKQPVIGPGEFYEYDSWSPINTEIGKMYGSFTMLNVGENQIFEVEVPEFKLNADHIAN